jgi:indole-3-glycerol phosphate synthase
LSATNCAILRKDFIIDKMQIAESIAAGADAVLLIVCVLKEKTKELLDTCTTLGIEALVEVGSKEELDFALEIGATLIAVNNRDLTTFEVNTEKAIQLKKHIPDNITSVVASGIDSKDLALQYKQCGYNAALIGEALVKSKDPKQLIKAMRLN